MLWVMVMPVHHQLPELAQTHVWVSDAIQPFHPPSSLLLPSSIFPSFRVFSNESVLCIRWPKDWSFSFSISPSNEYSGLISLLSKGLSRVFTSITVWKHCSTFFMVYLSDPYMTTGKTIALTIQTLVGKVMSLLFNMLSTLVIAFLSRSKRVLFCFFTPHQGTSIF